jgi:hypothetical protein
MFTTPIFIAWLVYISCLLLAHTVADFVFQTDWMATNKSSNMQALGLHIISYSSILALFVFASSFFIEIKLTGAILFVLCNAWAHLFTDYATSRIAKYFWIREKRHEFFVTIGFDQFAHIFIIMWSHWFVFIDL